MFQNFSKTSKISRTVFQSDLDDRNRFVCKTFVEAYLILECFWGKQSDNIISEVN